MQGAGAFGVNMPNDPFRWCRRIFASVDVVGSTQFKMRQPEDSGTWANVFRQFFDEFPTTLRSRYASLGSIAGGGEVVPMRVWKYIGDEILFVAELTRHEQVAFHVMAFKDALNEYALQFKKKPGQAGLALKGAIWGAGFPVSNAQVAPRRDGETHGVEDYLGPCVDQGFRLCSLADSRRVPLSVDIAYMLALIPLSTGHAFHVSCEEPKSHKGVPAPYPHIWLDRLDGKQTQEDLILHRKQTRKIGELRDYLDEVYAASRPGLFRPFIEGDPSPHFNVIPPNLSATRQRLIDDSGDKFADPHTAPAPLSAPEVPPEAPAIPAPPNGASSVA